MGSEVFFAFISPKNGISGHFWATIGNFGQFFGQNLFILGVTSLCVHNIGQKVGSEVFLPLAKMAF